LGIQKTAADVPPKSAQWLLARHRDYLVLNHPPLVRTHPSIATRDDAKTQEQVLNFQS
jgi:hypothetical protein